MKVYLHELSKVLFFLILDITARYARALFNFLLFTGNKYTNQSR